MYPLLLAAVTSKTIHLVGYNNHDHERGITQDFAGDGMKVELASLPRTQLSEQVERQRLTGELLEFIRYTYQPGAEFAVHQHEAEQLTIVLSGELVFTFPDTAEEVRLDAGEALLITSGRPHGAYVPETASTTVTHNIFHPVRQSLPQG